MQSTSRASIELRVKTNFYRFLWLRYVEAFDASQHCAKCLIGKYSKLLPFGPEKAGLHVWGAPERESRWLYLCGVSPAYATNLHVAMVRQPGARTEGENQAIYYRFDGWQQLEIHELPVPELAAFTAPFHTCRNFQFGWEYLPRVTAAGAPAVGGDDPLELELFANDQSVAENVEWQAVKEKIRLT